MIGDEKKLALALTFGILSFLVAPPVFSFPQYQAFVEKHSGRTVNCAMCHVSGDGPVGNGSGQIGSLTPEQSAQLNKARAAMQPGSDIDNPILNDFGNKIVQTVGMKKVLELRSDPAKLAEALGSKSDIDDDGISDAAEYLAGTDPLNKMHGEPGQLFWVNLNRYKFHIILAAIAVFFLDYGLAHLIKGLAIATGSKESK
ncbi:hypothetical protein BH10CYA1_BH10CYA1_13480 [soil metagenome]